MRIDEKKEPRLYQPAGAGTPTTIQDCATIHLEPSEQVTLVTDERGYDVCATAWGFYASPSLNKRLVSNGFKAALVRNLDGRRYLLFVHKEKGAAFEAFLKSEKKEVVAWLDEAEASGVLVCTVCGPSKVRTQFVVTRQDKYAITEQRQTKPATYRECAHCGAMVLEDDAHYETVYSEGSYYSVDGDPQAFLDKRFRQVISFPKGKSDNIERVERIQAYAKDHLAKTQDRRVLDLGAGMGVFLHQFLDSSWKGTALEPEPHAAQHLKKVLPQCDVVHGDVLALSPKATFDLITLNRVLEHIFDPVALLRTLHRHLDPQGLLYLEVPDVRSYTRDGANNEAFGYGHYCVYSPTALALAADRAGFEMEFANRTIEPSTKFTLYAFFRKK